MILIDTSAWIDFFRGTEPTATTVQEAVLADTAAICGPVETELRRGLRPGPERSRVLGYLSACRHLTQPTDLWRAAGELGYALQRQGLTVPSLDLLIAVHAISHHVPVLTLDRDFNRMANADIGLFVAALS